MSTTTVDYTNFLTHVPTQYKTNLDYTEGNNYLAAPLRNIPSQGLPVLPFPVEEDVYGHPPYDTLTRSSNDEGYYSVKTAYGDPSKQPQYYVGHCPSNKMVMPFNTAFTPTADTKHCNEPVDLVVEAYANEDDLIKIIKDMDILLFVNPETCGYSREALKIVHGIIDKKNIHYLKNPHSKQLFANFRGYATPYYFSRKHQTSHTGLLGSLHHIHEKLHKHPHHAPHPSAKPVAPPAPHPSAAPPMVKEKYEPQSSTDAMKQKIKEMNLLVVVTDVCPFCTSYVKMLTDAGVKDHVEIMNAKHPSAPKVHAVPMTISRKTNKSKAGKMNSLAEIIAALSP